MAHYQLGERVSINRPGTTGWGWSPNVPEGTKGTVRKVDEAMISGNVNYLVKFDNGEEEWVDQKSLIPA